MKKYVLGFAFSADKKELILIEKKRPQWQAGKLNGVGGKVENNESSFEAMIREFKEETGVSTVIEDWEYFGSMNFNQDIMGGQAAVYLFKMFNDVIEYCETVEEEEILKVNTDTCLDVFSCLPNLNILIPLALSNEFNFTELQD